MNALPSFEDIWRASIEPLAGRRLYYDSGANMVVLKVTWSGVRRRSSSSRESDVPIEAFMWAIEQLRQTGQVTRAAINAEFDGRFSSAVTVILAQVPELELLRDPLTLRVRNNPTVIDA